jgi:hypothetical protein
MLLGRIVHVAPEHANTVGKVRPCPDGHSSKQEIKSELEKEIRLDVSKDIKSSIMSEVMAAMNKDMAKKIKASSQAAMDYVDELASVSENNFKLIEKGMTQQKSDIEIVQTTQKNSDNKMLSMDRNLTILSKTISKTSMLAPRPHANK